MRRLMFEMLAVSALICMCSCDKLPGKMGKAKTPETSQEKFSYSIGLDIGSTLKDMPTELDMDFIVQGIKDTLYGNDIRLSSEEVVAVKTEIFNMMREEQQKKNAALSEKNRQEGDSFLSSNREKEGVVVTESGLQYVVLQQGNGEKPKEKDRVSVHYRGTTIDGTEFDNSYSRGQPATLSVNGVIPGWTEALKLMNVGSKYRLFVPSKLGYGERGAGKVIGPNSTLIFEIELLGIEKS